MAYITTHESKFEQLIGGTAVTPLTANVKLSAECDLQRGTLLTEGEDGVFAVCGAEDEAAAILACDVIVDQVAVEETAVEGEEEEAEAAAVEMVATVFVRGEFNRQSIIVAADDDIDSHESQLRKVGIYLTTLH